MAAHVRLKNEFTEDEKYHNPMSWLKYELFSGKFWLQVLEISANIFKQLPENIDYDQTAKILSVDPSPLNVVLLQEVTSFIFVIFEPRDDKTNKMCVLPAKTRISLGISPVWSESSLCA